MQAEYDRLQEEKGLAKTAERGIMKKEPMAASKEDSIRWLQKKNHISAEEKSKLVSYAAQQGVSLKLPTDTDVDVGLMVDMIESANKMLKIFPEFNNNQQLPFTIKVVNGMQANDFAEVKYLKHPRTIYLNANAFRDKNKLVKEYNKLVKKEWFPAGTDYRSIVYHEFGHMYAKANDVNCVQILSQITGEQCLSEQSRKAVEETIKKELSEYASNPENGFSECIAEVFSVYYSKTSNEFAFKFMKALGRR